MNRYPFYVGEWEGMDRSGSPGGMGSIQKVAFSVSMKALISTNRHTMDRMDGTACSGQMEWNDSDGKEEVDAWLENGDCRSSDCSGNTFNGCWRPSFTLYPCPTSLVGLRDLILNFISSLAWHRLCHAMLRHTITYHSFMFSHMM